MRKIWAGHWTIKIVRQNGRLLLPIGSCVSKKQKTFVTFCSGQPFICQEARQNLSRSATARDCETGLVHCQSEVTGQNVTPVNHIAARVHTGKRLQ